MNMRKKHLVLGKIETTHHTETSNDASNNESGPVVIQLQADAEGEDETGGNKTPFTANHITHWESEKCTEKGACREDRNLHERAH